MTISLINSLTHVVTGPLQFANPSAANGYDDAVFEGGRVFLSYTNPAHPGDATLVELLNGYHPSGVLLTRTILALGATGYNTVSGKIETIPQTDPDSLKTAPNGDLIFSSGADGTIIEVSHPGTAQQTVTFTPVGGAAGAQSGLDDVIKPSATAGTFYLTDTATNKVFTFHVSGLERQRLLRLGRQRKGVWPGGSRRPAPSRRCSPPAMRPISISPPRTAWFSSPMRNAAPMAHVDSVRSVRRRAQRRQRV